ncbi:hypothetical protein VN12_19820 [Pirellula sp. SH-Sr6A]|uniref:hypothetical protein n=1 Tax=Pirellula sp. SH-Sr6A TaxID=1632865 RepID=UPI00078D8D3B|nr:hypothetical protein [Pirellula sp. SH-Sr6A]AMV34383.1 hypothetical protein VN12_19820 [Pirellula sp. SH-Sr6A]
MTFKKVKPYTNAKDRMPQIRSLLRQGATAKQIAEMDFPAFEIIKVQRQLRIESEKKPKNNEKREPKDVQRCTECGCLADKKTIEFGECKGCICRAKTNFVRKGRFRV